MTDLGIAVAVATFLGGLAIGAYLNYLVETKPLIKRRSADFDMLYRMKKQGFVPQFDIEQRTEHDPSQEVVEY